MKVWLVYARKRAEGYKYGDKETVSGNRGTLDFYHIGQYSGMEQYVVLRLVHPPYFSYMGGKLRKADGNVFLFRRGDHASYFRGVDRDTFDRGGRIGSVQDSVPYTEKEKAPSGGTAVLRIRYACAFYLCGDHYDF